MKTLIVATDFSAAANNALEFGIEMAKKIEGSLLIFHAYQVPVSMADVPVVLVSADELKKNAEERLADIRAKIEPRLSGLKLYTEARLGDTMDELEQVCKEIQPFAVLMGTRGESNFERTLFGSTSLAAIRHLTCPVLAIPISLKYGGGIHKIGFACDFKQVVETTPAEKIKSFVQAFDAELHVLNVDYHDKHFTADTPEQSLMLDTLLQDLKPEYHFIEHKDIEDGINEFVRKNNIDLLLTIPKKHKLLEGIFHKSSTKQFVLEAEVPVLCVHEG